MNIFQVIFRKGFGFVDKKYMCKWCVCNNVSSEQVKMKKTGIPILRIFSLLGCNLSTFNQTNKTISQTNTAYELLIKEY